MLFKHLGVTMSKMRDDINLKMLKKATVITMLNSEKFKKAG